MRGVRAAWWTLAVVAVIFTVWSALSPVDIVSLSCAKGGTLGPGSPFTCDDPIVRVLGFNPVIRLGLAITLPPIAAAVIMRAPISWLVAAAFGILVGIGVANWADFWVLLAPAGLVGGFVSVLIAVTQLGAQARRNRQAERHRSGGLSSFGLSRTVRPADESDVDPTTGSGRGDTL